MSGKQKKTPEYKAAIEIIEKHGMPASPEAERSILGAVFLDNKLLAQARSLLKKDDFSLEWHRLIYAAMCNMQDKGTAIDYVTFMNFVGVKKLNMIGGPAYYMSLTDGVPRRPSIEHYCKIVRDKAILRQVIHTCSATASRAANQEETAQEIVSAMQTDMINMVRRDRTTESMAATANRIVNTMWGIRDGSIKVKGLTTSIPDLDELTGGIREAEFNVFGGRTSDGKSSLMRQCAAANAKQQKQVRVCTYEMTRENLMECMIASVARIPYEDIRNPEFLSNTEMQRVAEAAAEVASWPLIIDDMSGVDVGALNAHLRSGVIEGDQLQMIDYLQLIPLPGEDDTKKRVSKASATLRDCAKATKVPVVALSQLKRPPEERPNVEPTLFGLKESGDIENDCFQVYLIFRPQERDELTGRWEYSGKDWIFVAKNRNGKRGNVPVVYRGEFLQFEPRTLDPAVPLLPQPPQPQPYVPAEFTQGHLLENEGD